MVSNETTFRMISGRILPVLAAAIAALFVCAPVAYALDEGEDERNWELMVGGGVMWSPEFPGADELDFTLFPAIVASFETPLTRWFIDFNELGVELKFGSAARFSATAGVGLGDFEREDDDRDRFAGSASVKNGVRFFGQFNAPLPASFDLAFRATYFPIASSYAEADRKDQDYGGMTFQIYAEREWLLFPFFVYLSVGSTWMGKDYAEAVYGVEYATADFSRFKADAGFHDVFFLTNLMLFFSEHLGIGSTVECLYLLGDAADSPFADRAFQPTVGVYGLYRF